MSGYWDKKEKEANDILMKLVMADYFTVELPDQGYVSLALDALAGKYPMLRLTIKHEFRKNEWGDTVLYKFLLLGRRRHWRRYARRHNINPNTGVRRG